jgi:hypothetical protein
MKKTIFSIIIIILISISLTSINVKSLGYSTIESNHIKILNEILDTPPDWATHYFYGVIGLTSYQGNPEEAKGFIVGYCTDNFKGKFAGIIVDTVEQEPTGFILGYTGSPVLFGLIVNTNEQKIPIVGIGLRNETGFYFRIMSIVGPTMYIAGLYELIQ